jgi:hypothetical protein
VAGSNTEEENEEEIEQDKNYTYISQRHPTIIESTTINVVINKRNTTRCSW